MRRTVVAYGEILWDLLPTGAVLGGAPFNFVYRINSLGHRGVMVSRLGSDDLGDRALKIVEQFELESGYLQRDPVHSTGTVEVSFDEQRNPDYRIIPDVAYDYIRAETRLRRLLADADALCFGTLIQRSEHSKNTLYELLEAFSGTYVLLDINLRKDCYSRESIRDSIRRADILKLNDGEADLLGKIYGMPPASTGLDLAGFCDAVFAQSSLRYIVVTLGDRGAFAASREGRRVYRPSFVVPLRDPIGSGDAFTAGFLDALLNDKGLAQACRFGNAMGALVASQEGATRPLDRPRIEAFLATAEIGLPESRYRQFMDS